MRRLLTLCFLLLCCVVSAQSIALLVGGRIALTGPFTGATGLPDEYTTALLHFDGNYIDQAGNTWAGADAGNLSTAQKKFGSGSLLSSTLAAPYYLAASITRDIIDPAQDFAIDFWQMVEYLQLIGGPLNIVISGTGSKYINIEIRYSSTIGSEQSTALIYVRYYDGVNIVASAEALAADVLFETWGHLCFSVSSGVIYVFHNGIDITGDRSGSSVDFTPTEIRMSLAASSIFAAYVDELRIVNGTAPNAAFTPPTQPYGRPYDPRITLAPVVPSDYFSENIGVLKYIGPGSFQSDDIPTNISTVSAFRMSQHEITRAQFLDIMGADPSFVDKSVDTDSPVQQVSFYQAVAFCNKLSIAEGLAQVYTVSGVDFATLGWADIPGANNANWDAVAVDFSVNGYRLPTLAEWQWAAMGGYEDSFPDSIVAGINRLGYSKQFAGSDGSNNLADYAWHLFNSLSGGAYRSHPVGTKLPNEIDLHDMTGNVWEWCWDRDDTYRFIAGGGMTDTFSSYSLPTIHVQKGKLLSHSGLDNVGFRVARK
jgi:formylglycine-generating enzyme required for sulfatase activity